MPDDRDPPAKAPPPWLPLLLLAEVAVVVGAITWAVT